MYKKMLVPLDGSKLAEVVLEYSKELAKRLNLTLDLLHVCANEESEFVPLHRAYISQAAELLAQDARDIQESTGKIKTKVVEVRSELAIGHAADEILRYADEQDIDLILMATHGRSGAIGLWPMGDVAHKIVSSSPVPVWLVPARIPPPIVYDEWPTKKILVPLDGSELAEAVLPHVIALTEQRGSRLVEIILLRICETHFDCSDTLRALMPSGWQARSHPEIIERQHEAERYLNCIERQLEDTGLNVRSEVLMGEPASEIVGYTNRNPFNLVTMATHGYTGNMKWAYGSVAHKVLNGVTTPVFLVRPQPPD